MKRIAELPQALHEQLLALGQRRMLAAGEVLFLEGSKPNSIACVVSGLLQVRAPGRRDGCNAVAWFRPGQWFGEVSLLLGKDRSCDVLAESAAEVVVVSADAFRRLVQSDTAVLMAFTRLVCDKLNHTNNRLGMLCLLEGRILLVDQRMSDAAIGLDRPAATATSGGAARAAGGRWLGH